VVERTFSWFGRHRRHDKDFENLAETLATFVTLAPRGNGRGASDYWRCPTSSSGADPSSERCSL
jgi:hypothetical protein